MFTKNMLKFFESLRFLGKEHGYLLTIVFSETAKHVEVYFVNDRQKVVGSVFATFDEINRTETPGHLALKLFKQMEGSIK